MKTLKYLTICFVLCCLFTGNVFAQCVVGVSCNISGELDFCGSGIPASQAQIGDTIVYSVLIETSLLACPISNAVANLTLPDGSITPVPIPSNLPPDYSEFFPCLASYVVSAANLGQLAIDISPGGTDPTQPNEVRALVAASGTADTGGGNTDEAQGAAVRTTTIIATPCVEIVKEVCGYSKVGDTVTYTYTLWNCTEQIDDVPGPDLLITSIVDDVLGDLTAIALNECGPVLPWSDPPIPCEFQVDYVVPEDANDPLINVVTVNAEAIGSGLTTSDTASAEVDLLHPSFTQSVTCEGIVDGVASFTVEFCNTGDVPLLIDPDISDIATFELADGDCESFTVTRDVDSQCGCGSATLTVEAVATIPPDPYCELDNLIIPEPAVASDTCEVTGCNPCFTVEKNCISMGPVPDGELAQFEIIITNCGNVDLDFDIVDAASGLDIAVGPIGAEGYTTTVTVPADCATNSEVVENSVTVTAYCSSDGTFVGEDTATASCPVECGGAEGCTPGFWKNSTSCWGCYSTTTKLNQVFDFPGTPAKLVNLGNTTLLDALSLPGGKSKIEKAQILMRHAVSAVLNACSGNVEYPDSVAGIVDDVNEILANWSTVTGKDILSLKNQFQDWNQLGCPISSENSKNPCQRKDEVVNGY